MATASTHFTTEFMEGSTLLVAVGVVWALCSFLAYSYWRKKYPSSLSRGREAFLNACFDIDADMCRSVCFDGVTFVAGTRIPYSNVRGVKIVGSKRVRVFDPSLPHTSSWGNARIDGGPDRRYSDNPLIMHSERLELAFEGITGFELQVYVLPGDTHFREHALARLDQFLAGGFDVSYEPLFEGFVAAYFEHERSTATVRVSRRRLAECEAAISAAEHLGLDLSTSPGVTQSVLSARDEEALLRGQLESLQADIGAMNQRMGEIIALVRKQRDDGLAHRELEGFSVRRVVAI